MKKFYILRGSILPEVCVEPMITIDRVECTCDLHFFLSTQAKIELIKVSLPEFCGLLNPYTRYSLDRFDLLWIIHTTKDNIWSSHDVSYVERGMFYLKERRKTPRWYNPSELSKYRILHSVLNLTNDKESSILFKCLDDFFLCLKGRLSTSWSTHQKNIPLLAIEKRYIYAVVIIEAGEVCDKWWSHIYELLDVSGSGIGGSWTSTFWFAIWIVCVSFRANWSLSRRSSQSFEAW